MGSFLDNLLKSGASAAPEGQQLPPVVPAQPVPSAVQEPPKHEIPPGYFCPDGYYPIAPSGGKPRMAKASGEDAIAAVFGIIDTDRPVDDLVEEMRGRPPER